MAIMTLNVFAGYTKQIVVPGSVLDDSWQVNSSYLSHVLNVKSTVHKKINALKLNTLYRITYEVFDYVNCSVYLKVGTKEGPVRTGNGVFTESYIIETDADRTLTFVSDGILKIRNISYEEKVFTTSNIPFTDTTQFENKSWTLSYSFYSNSWISWHSYMPLYYIHNQENLYSFIGAQVIWKHNIEGLFTKYYNQDYPFVIEYVPPPSIQTQLIEDLTFITKARKWNPTEQEYEDDRFTTFNKMIAYNNRSSTGEVMLVVKDTQANPQNWLFHQITNTPGQVLITEKEGNWNLNDLRDFVSDPSKPLFSKQWSKIKDQYFTDKVVNTSNIDYNKPWSEVESLRDKFVIIRLKLEGIDDVNLIFNYGLTTESTSNR